MFDILRQNVVAWHHFLSGYTTVTGFVHGFDFLFFIGWALLTGSVTYFLFARYDTIARIACVILGLFPYLLVLAVKVVSMPYELQVGKSYLGDGSKLCLFIGFALLVLLIVYTVKFIKSFKNRKVSNIE